MDIIGLCLPLVDCAARLAKEAYKTAEDARYTKKTCLLLSDRLEAGSRALSDLYRHREEKEKEEKFKSSNFYNSLQSYVNAATEIKRFIDELAESGGAMKYLKSRSHKVKVNQLVKRFDDAIADLKLGINIDEFKKLDDLESVIETEFKKMSLTLETIEASLVSQTNDIKDMKLTMDTLASMNNTDSKQLDIKTIPPGDLKDPEPEEVVKRGKITKKLLKGIEPVACKPLTDEVYNGENFNTLLAILSKLVLSNNIIRFYGILSSDGGASKVMVFEWAEHGNLKSLYERCEITWKQKLKIAHDVCAGLSFLHECTIYHHDVRCENILIMENVEKAKIANFTLSREYNNRSVQIKSINELIPWMAPEKLKDPDNYPYNIKFPYMQKFDADCVKISQHIKNGKREDISSFNHLNDIQKCFKNIIVKAWNQEPSLRQNMPFFLNQLTCLYRNHYSPKIPPRCRSSSNSSINSSLGREILLELDDDDLSLDTLNLDDIEQVTMTLEDGIKLHKDKSLTSRKMAWECFKYHAETLKDPRAIYWKGYYLLEGYGGVPKDLREASKCFKEAADQDISDAQVRYAFSIISKVGDPLKAAEFLKYLEKAAFHENQAALYNLGNIYYEGKLGLPRNQKQAIMNYKKAALKGHDKSIDKLKSLKINVYDD
ncbi:5102_t:CDS:2 [Entrophospora sp. SA101]|nr:5102_t:CDS:2 [Entrophospora sp. SA101]